MMKRHIDAHITAENVIMAVVVMVKIVAVGPMYI